MSSRKSRAARAPTVTEQPKRSDSRFISGRWVVIAVLLVGVATMAWMWYSRNAAAAHATSDQPQAAPSYAQSPPVAARINPARAMTYVREIVGFGPRFVGSPRHKKTETYLRTHLQGINVEEDNFTASTPTGPLAMRNIIAKFPGAKPGVVVIATHYDTLYGRKDFVGANDGASGTGLLLELANHLRGPGRNGYSVWLVWLDGEEAIRQWSDSDSTYGSRHLAEKWQKDGTSKQVKAFLLADMIGDADLNIERDRNSTPWLEELVYEAATALGYQSHFFRRENAIDDDHVPFARAGVAVADLIDFDYGYDNSYWHSQQDTLDKLSPHSLEIVGDVLLQSVALIDRR